MDRYVITYTATSETHSPIRLETYAAEMAETPDEAAARFHAKHPAMTILNVERVTDGEDAFLRYGMGAWTDEERQAHSEKLSEEYAAMKSSRDEAEIEVKTFEPDDIEAMIAYRDRVKSETTPNVEGVHIGDLFYVMWGYDQTNYDFFQVVDLRGGHTVVLREIESFAVPYGNMQGLCRPHRDHFKTAKLYAPRTRLHERFGLMINAPVHDGHTLRRCKDTDVFDYSTYA